MRRRTRLALCLLCAPVLVAADASAMWRSLGVAPGTAQMHRLERLTSGRNVFLDSALIERRHAVLARELGPQAARVVLLRHPLLLTHDLEETLQPKLRTLEALLPGLNISRAVLRAPALLQLSSETTIAPRLKSLEERLGSRSAAIRAISRTPTLLNLRDIEARYERLRVALPGLKEKELAKVVGQRPELLTFNDSSIQAKAEALAELFHVTDASRIIRRDPRLLTYQPTRLAEKVATFEETLPGVDVRKMLASAPSLLSADVDEAIPRKLAQLSNLLPSLDIDRLVAQAPQLLEYDVENSLVPRLAEIRKLFADPPKRSATPGAAAAAAEAALCNQSGEPLELPSGASNVRSLAANKLLRQRGKVARPIKRSTRRASTRETRAAAANVDPFGQVTNTLRGAAQPLSSTAMAPSIIGLLRLAALDVAVVRARMHQLEKLLPEEQVQHMVRRCELAHELVMRRSMRAERSVKRG